MAQYEPICAFYQLLPSNLSEFDSGAWRIPGIPIKMFGARVSPMIRIYLEGHSSRTHDKKEKQFIKCGTAVPFIPSNSMKNP
jgi:hypothetical protein